MCESCNGNNGFDRRDFLKIGSTAAALGGLWATGVLAQDAGDGGVVMPPVAKTRTKIAVVFMYPPADVVNEGRMEDSWAKDKWFTYPGNQYEPEMNHEKFQKKIEEIGETYSLNLDFQGVIYTRAQMAAFIEKTNAELPDALLIVNFWNTFSSWVLEMADKIPVHKIVYHPVGSNHQLPPKGLMTAPNMIYIHSLENWEALEGALAAVNAKKQIGQSRLLRVTDVAKQTGWNDPRTGFDVVTIPAAEYNAIFDSIQANDELVRDAMAFKAKALAVLDVEDRYFVEGFRARLAVGEIMRRYGADGITIKCLMLKERKPCIAFSLNNSALIPCACEDFPESAMTMMIGKHLFGRAGFMHNPEFDIDRNQYYGSHCTCALEMRGPGQGELPFLIRPFTHQLPKTAALDVQMPPGERCFLTKYIASTSSVFAYAGTMVGSPEMNTAGGCATRFVMDVDKTDDVCSIYGGPHPILYFGNVMMARRMKVFAKLLGVDFTGNV